jgi:hypothetical protein
MKDNSLVRPLRIELSSMVLQTTAMTTLAQDALVEMERIELSISGCKPDVFPLALHPHKIGPCGEIRTPDPLLPKQMRYQTALHTDKTGAS